MQNAQEEPPRPRYEPLLGSISVDLSDSALKDAVQKLGPARNYQLFVSPHLFSELRTWLRWAVVVLGNTECVVHVDYENSPREWYLSANGRRIGSKGAE